MGNRKKIYPKAIQVIEQQCKVEGLAFTRLRTPSGIYLGIVRIEGGGAEVTYRPNDGAFAGVTPDGLHFNSKKALKDDWFNRLKAFFHAEEPVQIEGFNTNIST